MVIENFLFVRLAIAARRRAADIVFSDDAISYVAAAVEQVQVEMR